MAAVGSLSAACPGFHPLCATDPRAARLYQDPFPTGPTLSFAGWGFLHAAHETMSWSKAPAVLAWFLSCSAAFTKAPPSSELIFPARDGSRKQVPSWAPVPPACLLLGACRASLSTAAALLGVAATLSSFYQSSHSCHFSCHLAALPGSVCVRASCYLWAIPRH